MVFAEIPISHTSRVRADLEVIAATTELRLPVSAETLGFLKAFHDAIPARKDQE